MTKMSAIDNRPEIRLPVIVCPFCGEKDPGRLKLATLERNYNLDFEHNNTKVTVDGECISCLTSFEIIVSARTPYK
jgi:hypothetical protein